MKNLSLQRQELKEVTDIINKMCGDNGTTTISEIADEMGISYSKAHRRIHKGHKEGCIGIIYPGLGMGSKSERYIYVKYNILN